LPSLSQSDHARDTGRFDRAHSRPDPLRILVVEDDCGFSRFLERALPSALDAGVAVTCVERLDEAAEHLRTRPVDCVLLDLALPDAAGVASVAGVREVSPDVPLVVLTGCEEEIVALRAFRLGAQEFLVKTRADAWTVARAIRFAVERKEAERELSRLALHDPLTGLPNRVLLTDRLTLALARGRREESEVGLLFADLDGFKEVNDRLGHESGDRLLSTVARRLAQAVRPGDTVGRLGGDEFVVLCEGLRGAEDALFVAERIVRAVEAPIRVAGTEVSVDVSVGIAVTGRGTVLPDALLRAADAAMYRAKRRGGAGIAF
jgi:diguanylate cyclase (GGDEF)-like protein